MGRIRVLIVVGVVVGGAVLAGAAALAAGGADSSDSTAEGAEQLSTGEEYANELGLIRHEALPKGTTVRSEGNKLTIDGVPIPGCPSEGYSAPRVAMVKVLDDGDFYCLEADSELEGWIIGERLNGKVPTEAEIQEMADALSEE